MKYISFQTYSKLNTQNSDLPIQQMQYANSIPGSTRLGVFNNGRHFFINIDFILIQQLCFKILALDFFMKLLAFTDSL